MIQSIGESKHRIIANKTLHRTAFPQFRIFLTLSVKPGADCYTQLLPLTGVVAAFADDARVQRGVRIA